MAVDDFVAVKAHDFNKGQQTSISGLQQVQQQSLGINKIQQISISSGIWFGTRCSTLKSYTEALHFQQRHLAHLLKVVEVDGNWRLRQLHFRLQLRKECLLGIRTSFSFGNLRGDPRSRPPGVTPGGSSATTLKVAVIMSSLVPTNRQTALTISCKPFSCLPHDWQ